MNRLPDRAYLHERFSYDHNTGRLIWRTRPREAFAITRAFISWNKNMAGTVAGCKTEHKIVVGLDYQSYSCHRIIYKMMTGEEPEEIDHIDGNPFNNRISNLRPATSSQNKANRAGKARSGFKGVSPNGKGWMARLQFRGKVHCLGTYRTPEEAHRAYSVAAKRVHGEFANLGSHPATRTP